MKRNFVLHGGRAVLIGLAVSIILTVGIISLLSSLLLAGTVPEAGMNIGACIGLIISEFIGALIAARGGDTKIAIRIATHSAIYGLLLFAVGILILDGPVSHIIRNAVCILIGCVASCAICIRKRASKPKRKKGIR